MTFVDIKGQTSRLDCVLTACLRSGLFHPEYAAKLSEYSVGAPALLRNPYGGLMVKFGEISTQLKLSLEYSGYRGDLPPPEGRETLIEEAHAGLNRLAGEYPDVAPRQRKLREEIEAYAAALEMSERLGEVNFERLADQKQLKVRFGRLPTSLLAKLNDLEDKPFYLYLLGSGQGYTWCLYAPIQGQTEQSDAVFRELRFERLRVPGLSDEKEHLSVEAIRSRLTASKERLERAVQELDKRSAALREEFLLLYSQIRCLHDCYDLRKYAVIVRDQFHVVGYVMTREKDAFLALFSRFEDIAVTLEPAGNQSRLPPPVRLRNNRFVKPFEMFVSMYGMPSYHDIDPTPFVAVTYSLLFGIMFGDLGHGLVVMLLGILLWKWKKMALGPIMARIGAVSMVFGFAYGSVFGFEHLLDPVFHRMGFHEKPIEVMDPSTTNLVLVAAVIIGVAVIVSVILFNMLVGLRHRDWERVLLSHNGLCGLVFYSSVLAAALGVLLGRGMPGTWYLLLLIVLPLLLIFLKEPISRLARFLSKDAIIHSDEDLVESTVFQSGSANLPEMFRSHYMVSRFGRIPTDSYSKLEFYSNEPFVFYPLKTDQEYIWLVYAMATPDKEEMDAIFHDLYFERIYIPDEDLESVEAAEAFIRKCIDVGGTPEEVKPHEKYGSVKRAKHKSIYNHMFPDGFAAFFLETFFELFEVILSFISNTMSFLRVGGFILIHAGMMSVVFTLAEMVNGGAGVAVIVGGNLFVMALEGLIVGIQVLRLEFYEMFSRFYDANGEPFQPVQPAGLDTAA